MRSAAFQYGSCGCDADASTTGTAMKCLLILSVIASSALAATVVDPSTCSTYPCLIFDDNFDFLDHDVWEHEITMSGGGNWEFQAYVNNRSISYTRGGILYIRPELTSNQFGDAYLSSGTWSLWGMNGPNDVCTGNSYYGCERIGNAVNILNPTISAKLRSQQNFAFRYGRLEVYAKMPRGDWLWPAIWLLPQRWGYGDWPASGEVDVVESRGNDNFGTLGNEYAGSTLHWGPYYPHNGYPLTHVDYASLSGSFADSFHLWAVEWTDVDMRFYLDGNLIMTVDPVTNFWDFGNFAANGVVDNPWAAGGKMAPFDQKFYIILNLAVGGTNGFFPDGISASKPWSNTSPQAFLDFWNAKDQWLPTWTQGENRISEGAALQVDYIRVYKMSSTYV